MPQLTDEQQATRRDTERLHMQRKITEQRAQLDHLQAAVTDMQVEIKLLKAENAKLKQRVLESAQLARLIHRFAALGGEV